MRSSAWARLAFFLGIFAGLPAVFRIRQVSVVLVVLVVAAQLFCVLMMVWRWRVEGRAEAAVWMLRDEDLRRRIAELLRHR